MKTIYISIKRCELNIKKRSFFDYSDPRVFNGLGFAQLTVPIDKCIGLNKNEIVDVIAFDKKEKIKGRFVVCDVNHKQALLLSSGGITHCWRDW